jgi:hypothetical protein
MAEPSKFLKYQDKNGDFLIDECEVEVPGEGKKCLDCNPKPRAIVPNWRKTIGEPFLNERECLYQISIQTSYTDTGGSDASLEERFKEYLAQAIDIFLTEYEKEYSTESFLILEKEVQYDLRNGFDLEARANSRLVLLYSVEFSTLEQLPEAVDDDEDDESEEPVTVGYTAGELKSLLLRVRKGLNLYSRYVRYHNYIDEEDLFFTESGKKFDIDSYGDTGFNRTKIMSQVYIQLDRWLVSKGFNLPGGGLSGAFKDRIIRLKFGFTRKFKLKKLKVYSVGCAEKPKVFKGRQLSGLNRKAPFKDPTAMAYLAQLRRMESDLTARVPKNYVDFLIDYTYPDITVRRKAEIQESIGDQSCVAQAIGDTANGFLQTAVDDFLGIGDAIAGLFHQEMCKQLEDARKEQIERGDHVRPIDEIRMNRKEKADARKKRQAERETNRDARQKERRINRDARQAERDLRDEELDKADTFKEKREVRSDYRKERRDSRKALGATALEQAYAKLEKNPNVFVRLCAEALIQGTGFGSGDIVRDFYDGSLNQMKICGLMDFLLEAIQCLFGGLTLEEALLIVVTKALNAMGIENFGVLFAGLPPDEQAKLDELVKKNLAEAIESRNTNPGRAPRTVGENDNSISKQYDTVDPEGNARVLKNLIKSIKRPFEDQELIEQERTARVADSYGSTTVSAQQYQASKNDFGKRRTIGTVYNQTTSELGYVEFEIPDDASPVASNIQNLQQDAAELFSDSAIMEAYIKALIEVYSDRLLDLVDKLNAFPGAELISKALATINCPRPPLFTPSIMDFIKDIELPFCRNIGDLTLPKLFIPKIDLGAILKALIDAIKEAIRRLVLETLMKLIVKFCEILGDAICKALETAGDIIGNLPGLISGNTTFREIIRESICGPDAPEEKIDQAIQDIFSSIGGAGSSLANKDKILELNEAIASSSTRQEIINASLGNPSNDFLAIVDTIIEYEFADFRDTFPNRDSIAEFYRNFGNLLPPEFRQSLEDSVTPVDDNTPANPTLCATPDQIEQFCSVRSQILEGRASPEQIEALCRRPIDDFDTLADIQQNGIPLLDNLGPLQSSPGCNDGLFPREPEELEAVASKGLSDALENLKIAYSYDMLGNGPFKKNWGFVNMVLSDTMGRPYTAHRRKNNFDPGALQYVDFYADSYDDFDDELNFARPGAQRGAFPKYIAEWQAIYYSQLNKENVFTINLNNEFKEKKTKFISFKSVDSGTTNGIEKKNLTRLPDFGYNYELSTTEKNGEEGLNIKFASRKKTADLLLKWRDNAGGGLGSLEPLTDATIPTQSSLGDDGTFTVGYNFRFFFADFDGTKNRKDDNVRLQIVRLLDNSNHNYNTEYKQSVSSYAGSASDLDNDVEPPEKEDSKIIKDQEFEFMSFDEGLDGIIDETGQPTDDAAEQYPIFLNALEATKAADPPQMALMRDILGISAPQARILWNDTVSLMIDEMGKNIFTLDNKAFNYGAKSDILTPEDAEYGVIRGGSFVPYADATNSEGDSLSNSDAELGMSRDQYNNRDNPEKTKIVYLDPAAHGGSYTNPKYYIKPTDNDGWLGLINVMFPELSPCKPYRTDLVDFADISSVMSNSYSTSPDDKRLKSDPDCVTEKPFDRILDRSAKSGIKGLIMAACRIYASINFLKSIATFSRYKPDFKNNFSNLYASYIVEEMEKGMKDSQSGFAELFNPFKDEEFWYAFLEQAVQTYHDEIEAGEITDVPINVQSALIEIGKVQREYKYPGKKALKDAKKIGDAGTFQTLKGYRENKNLETVKAAEKHAKVILKEYVAKEVSFIADIFENNLIKEGFVNEDDYVNNIYYHILTKFTDGANLTLDRLIKEEVQGLGEGGYTDGDEFSLEDGTPYVGYYHVFEDEEGQLIFMVGEEHSDENQQILTPFARNVKMNIGGVSAGINDSVSGSNPFVIKKYLKVNGTRKDMSEVGVIANGANGEQNVSDIYPGTLEFVYGPSKMASPAGTTITGSSPGKPIVGLKGEIGIRYGLALFARTEAGLKEITNSEIDALDLPLKMLKPLEDGSKELFCLINKLVDDPKFKAFFSYCIPANKLLSGLAIYNAFTFLPSIGEVVADGKKRQINSGLVSKPGLRIDETGEVNLDQSIPGWYKPSQRPNFTPFSLTWDEWDKITLRRSDAIIKKMFKSYYYSRNFDDPQEGESGAKIVIKNLKELFQLAPGQRIMPWWKRRSSNPFNNKDELCERKE